MKIRFDITRCDSATAAKYNQSIVYETDDVRATVATALNELNATPGLVDLDGRPVKPIVWQCSCLQKKCGACAMLINGVPELACDYRLVNAKSGAMTLAPLRKFPVVADLMVDRSAMYDNLTALKSWLDEPIELADVDTDTAYEAARCLQCGCCLEVCPNFEAGDGFTGMASMPPLARLLAEMPPERQKEIRRQYRKRFFAGCGKSLACRNICPAGVDIDRLLVNSNAIALWKRWIKRQRQGG